MPDRINFITQCISKKELDLFLPELLKLDPDCHVRQNKDVYNTGKEMAYFVSGQTWDDSEPRDLMLELSYQGISFAWVEYKNNGGFENGKQ